MLTEHAYELEELCFAYKNKQLIDSLSLSLPAGSVCAVMGPNGSGKSTLLLMLLGWIKPDSGTVRVFGKDITSLSHRERGRTISLLPQMENLGFDYTVMEYILLGRAPHLGVLQQPCKKDRIIAEAALEKVNALFLQKRTIPSLSGGEIQTMLMARALTQQPRILLLDEPANHLDPARKRRMLNIIKGFRNSGRSLIFTTHDPDSAVGVADYLVLMSGEGRVQHGPFNDLFSEENLSELYRIPMKIIHADGAVAVSY